MDSNTNEKNICVTECSEEERIAVKYRFLRDKIIFNYVKGCRILKICKIVAAVLFLIFTFAGSAIGSKTGNQLQWLQAWILLIFLNIIVFVIADYSKYLMQSKVIPYLEDDSIVEFGEYDIFADDGEDEEEE